MRELLRVLCQRFGVILPSGAFEFPVAEGEGEDSITYSDGLSFSYTDNGIEGPCWATLFADPPSVPEGCRREGGAETPGAVSDVPSLDGKPIKLSGEGEVKNP
jgi:hypothetical protein